MSRTIKLLLIKILIKQLIERIRIVAVSQSFLIFFDDFHQIISGLLAISLTQSFLALKTCNVIILITVFMICFMILLQIWVAVELFEGVEILLLNSVDGLFIFALFEP